MKIVVEVSKPRAKWLNDILRAKRCVQHKDPRRPSRQALKQSVAKQLDQ